MLRRMGTGQCKKADRKDATGKMKRRMVAKEGREKSERKTEIWQRQRVREMGPQGSWDKKTVEGRKRQCPMKKTVEGRKRQCPVKKTVEGRRRQCPVTWAETMSQWTPLRTKREQKSQEQ